MGDAPSVAPVIDWTRRLVDYFLICGASDDLAEAAGSGDDNANPLRRLYAPRLLARYPFVDHADAEFPENCEHFCFPSKISLVHGEVPLSGSGAGSSSRSLDAVDGDEDVELHVPAPTYHTFALTEMSGTKLYGHVVSFYEPITEAARGHLLGRIDRWLDAAGEAEQPALSEFVVINKVRMEAEGAGRVYVPKALCIVSHWPFLTFFGDYLKQLYLIVTGQKGFFGLDVERYVAHICHEIPLPPPGKLEVGVKLHDVTLYLSRPPANKYHPVVFNFSLEPFFLSLSVANVLTVFACAVTECKMVLYSRRYSMLHLAAEIISGLMYPLRWQHVFIPVLPAGMLSFLHAPMPFLIGIHASMRDSEEPPSDVVRVDLDADQVTCPDGDTVIPSLPKSIHKKLAGKLEAVYSVLRERYYAGDRMLAEGCFGMSDEAFPAGIAAWVPFNSRSAMDTGYSLAPPSDASHAGSRATASPKVPSSSSALRDARSPGSNSSSPTSGRKPPASAAAPAKVPPMRPVTTYQPPSAAGHAHSPASAHPTPATAVPSQLADSGHRSRSLSLHGPPDGRASPLSFYRSESVGSSGDAGVRAPLAEHPEDSEPENTAHAPQAQPVAPPRKKRWTVFPGAREARAESESAVPSHPSVAEVSSAALHGDPSTLTPPMSPRRRSFSESASQLVNLDAIVVAAPPSHGLPPRPPSGHSPQAHLNASTSPALRSEAAGDSQIVSPSKQLHAAAAHTTPGGSKPPLPPTTRSPGSLKRSPAVMRKEGSTTKLRSMSSFDAVWPKEEDAADPNAQEGAVHDTAPADVRDSGLRDSMPVPQVAVAPADVSARDSGVSVADAPSPHSLAAPPAPVPPPRRKRKPTESESSPPSHRGSEESAVSGAMTPGVLSAPSSGASLGSPATTRPTMTRQGSNLAVPTARRLNIHHAFEGKLFSPFSTCFVCGQAASASGGHVAVRCVRCGAVCHKKTCADRASGSGCEPRFDVEAVRAAFLNVFVTLLKGYRARLLSPDEDDWRNPREISEAELFNKDAYLNDCEREFRGFLSRVLESQAFAQFSIERIEREPNDFEVLFFDESIKAKHNRSITKLTKSATPFLDDRSYEVSATFDAPPPTPVPFSKSRSNSARKEGGADDAASAATTTTTLFPSTLRQEHLVHTKVALLVSDEEMVRLKQHTNALARNERIARLGNARRQSAAYTHMQIMSTTPLQWSVDRSLQIAMSLEKVHKTLQIAAIPPGEIERTPMPVIKASIILLYKQQEDLMVAADAIDRSQFADLQTLLREVVTQIARMEEYVNAREAEAPPTPNAGVAGDADVEAAVRALLAEEAESLWRVVECEAAEHKYYSSL